jgi:prepilin-type N-terminal cleavage/methylation domain-containing protein
MSAMQFGKTNINIQNKIHTMKMTKNKLAKGFTLVELLVVIAIIAALAALSTPVVLKQQKKANATQAINNAKQIWLLLFEYDQDNGAYPKAGTSSNKNFQVFGEDGYTSSEEIFYAKTAIAGFTKPDGDVSSGKFAAAGEVGFAYVEGCSTGSVSSTPLVAAPPLAADDTAKFDANAFGGTAVVLQNDGGVKTYRIPDGGIILNKVTGSDADVFTSLPTGAAYLGPR